MKSKNVLIVEDDLEIREALREILMEESHSVQTAANGAEALKSLEAIQKPDLILLDMMMPIMDGYHFRMLQMKDQTISQIPTIVLSADRNFPYKMKDLGIKHFIKKPLELDRLLDLINDV